MKKRKKSKSNIKRGGIRDNILDDVKELNKMDNEIRRMGINDGERIKI